MDLPPPCKFFHAGTCFKGADCPFIHPTQKCKSFEATGFCQYGYRCHFRHDLSKANYCENPSIAVPDICPFFLAGQCKFNEHCSRSHQLNFSEVSNQMTLDEFRAQQNAHPKPTVKLTTRPETEHISTPDFPNTARPYVQKPTIRKEQGFLKDLSQDDLDQMKNLEVDRLLKLYPYSLLKQTSEPNDKHKTFSLLFSSKDPDWVCLFWY